MSSPLTTLRKSKYRRRKLAEAEPAQLELGITETSVAWGDYCSWGFVGAHCGRAYFAEMQERFAAAMKKAPGERPS